MGYLAQHTGLAEEFYEGIRRWMGHLRGGLAATVIMGNTAFGACTGDPQLNGYVEQAHRTHTEGFYEVTESSFDLPQLRGELLEWEQVYNTIRPHQALGYLTPLNLWSTGSITKERRGDVSLIIWTRTRS